MYLAFELYQHQTKADPAPTEEEIQNNLEIASDFFRQIHHSLEFQSEQISTVLRQGLRSGHSPAAIYHSTQKEGLWGITVLKNEELWLWDGFTLSTPRLRTTDLSEDIRTVVTSYSNIILLLRIESFELENDSYTLLTAKRLRHSINLPFIRESEYSLSGHPGLSVSYPVEFSFFEPVPDNAISKPLTIPGIGSIGLVYSLKDQESVTTLIGNSGVIFIRSIFIAIILFLSLMISATLPKSGYKFVAALSSIGFILLIWPYLIYSEIHSFLAGLYLSANPGQDQLSIEYLLTYSLNASFILLLYINLSILLTHFRKPLKSDNHFYTFLRSALFGSASALILLFFSSATNTLLTESFLIRMDMDLTPDHYFLLFSLFSALFFFGSSGMIASFGYFLFVLDDDKSAVIIVLSILFFICICLLAILITPFLEFFSVEFPLILAIFILILFMVHLHHKEPGWLIGISGFRKLMFLVLSASSVVFIMIWNTTDERLDRDLFVQINEFTEVESAVRSDVILSRLLSELERNLSHFVEADIENRSPFLLNQFQRSVINGIRNESQNYSFHIRLLTTDNEEISNYSTTLDTPNWSPFYSTNLMLRSHRGERLRWQTNRPIIWDRPAGISERYTTFNRGWIPLYDPDQTNQIIAWIAGEIYRERSDFQKPLRAVLTADSDRDWRQSFYLSEYLGERLIRSSMKGTYHNQPQYNRLPQRELELALQDSITHIKNHTASGSFREILIHSGNRRIIKASTPYPGFNQNLFSYFRLQIIMVWIGLIIFLALSFTGFKDFRLFNQNKQFKNRLIDGLSLATILFLTVLIFSTQYTVGIQNEKSVERSLLNDLAVVSESLRERSLFAPGVSSDSLLADMTTVLNTDLMIYEGAQLAVSTTPQIFQNLLIPEVIPFRVFDQLYNRGRIHYLTNLNLGDEQMLIGYRAMFNTEGEPVGAIAIPTFLQSPVYMEQLLDTTSYLFVMYLFIFSVFIAGTVLLSNQLTKPLKIIQAGLSKISSGNMENKVPVTSRDEIGSLAKAYNEMVSRLDDARQELLRAERETAWKEMAQQVAHEIKNPLTPMKLNLQHLQRLLESNPENVMELKPVIEKTASNIIEQIESLSKIASDFSKFAKPIREPLVPFQLNNLIESVIELYEPDNNIAIQLNQPESEIEVNGVEDELRRALINLIKNAVEASGDRKAEIQVALKKRKESAIITIKDNGTGINEEDKEKIFTPRFSTKSSGTGLGLAITKQIIEAHQGEIHFTSDKVKGTTFTIRLPLLK